MSYIGPTAYVYGDAQVGGRAVLTDHMVVDRPDGFVCMGPIGSEHRWATAAWDYQRREICVRAGCWYGSLTELEARIAPGGDHGWLPEHEERFRIQYECLIAAASWIPEPDRWIDGFEMGLRMAHHFHETGEWSVVA